MFNYIWPVAIIVFSNILYQFCAKGKNILPEFAKANWATVVLGIVITGLEVGFIFAYKAGWQVSILATVTNAFLAVGLLILGFAAYHEQLNWSKLLGVAICLVGLFFINRK